MKQPEEVVEWEGRKTISPEQTYVVNIGQCPEELERIQLDIDKRNRLS